MEFTEAIRQMEKGAGINRAEWEGYLFLDIDGNIKHAGIMGKNEKHWLFDAHKTDWEICMDKVENKKEITESRMEALMDSNTSHMRRLYYLEEMIEGQHKAFKRISDSVTAEMDETRKALAFMVKSVPAIMRSIEKLLNTPEEYKNMEKSVVRLTDMVKELSKKIEVKPKKTLADVRNKVMESEKIEMEEVKEQLQRRKDKKSTAN